MSNRVVPLLLWCLLAPSPGRGEIVRDYGYPFADPVEASVLGPRRSTRWICPNEARPRGGRSACCRAASGRKSSGTTPSLRYALSAQPGPAPLAFIIPGTGATPDSSKSLVLERALYRAGLHVVSLPSPLLPNFVVSASTSYRPGILTEDSRDVYRVTELIGHHVGDEIAITGYDLVGYSLGGTQAAFVARLDEARRSFEFDRVLLINPPVSLEESAKVLDGLFEEHIPSIATFNALFTRLMQVLSEFYSPTDPMLLSDDLVYDTIGAGRCRTAPSKP